MKDSAILSHDQINSIASNAHVVFLVNFLSPNHLPVLQEIVKRFGKLTVLCCVEMESNRVFKPEWGDLDVALQKTWTLTRTAHHPSGYKDVNYIHIPLDTLRQLRSLKPDAVVSYELGARTVFSWLHRVLHRRCALIAGIGASERSEAGRGFLRRFTRRRLFCAALIGSPIMDRVAKDIWNHWARRPEYMSPWDYAADPSKPYRGELTRGVNRSQVNVLTVGQLADRKGVLPAIEQLANWARKHPNVSLNWQLLGSGPQEAELRQFAVPPNMKVIFCGHCGPEVLRAQYRDNDVLLFPTLGDEWGMVVDEALFSGLPVIGSIHAQAVPTLIVDNENGWSYDPESAESLGHPLGQLVGQSDNERWAMKVKARESVASRTPQTAADQFVFAVANAMQRRTGNPKSDKMMSHNSNTTESDTEVNLV